MSSPEPNPGRNHFEVSTTWHDARYSHPRDGGLVLAAVTGRHHPEAGKASTPELDFWFVFPMHFRLVHPVEGTGQVLRNRYIDADRVVRRPLAAEGDEDEVVTHWAELPTLPGVRAWALAGAAVAPALGVAHNSP